MARLKYDDEPAVADALRQKIEEALDDASPEQLRQILELLGADEEDEDEDDRDDKDVQRKEDGSPMRTFAGGRAMCHSERRRRREWAGAVFHKFSESFELTGVDKGTLTRNAERASDEDFAAMQREWAGLTPLPTKKRA